MRVVGIIAEYNPLHNGHIYHIEQARALSRADYCVVVMSGNFVQRGEPACTNKFLRAEWAIKSGADVVIELPSIYAVSSAERFAIGGIRTLLATGVVTDLAFGCEETDSATLCQLSDIISSEPPAYRDALGIHLAEGKSYPRARVEALADYGVPDNMLDAIVQPNNILAIEYLNALRAYAPAIEPLPVARIGTGYLSEDIAGEYASATAIRKAITEGKREVLRTMPSYVGGPLVFDDAFMITSDTLSDMTLYAIRRLKHKELTQIPDVSEGLENVIYQTVRRASTLEEFLFAVKSKRYTLARIKRIATNALLGITLDQVHAAMSSKEGSYLRVLAFRRSARPLLGEIARRKTGAFILRNADADACPQFVQRCLETDALSTDLIAYATRSETHRDYEGPIIVT